MWQMMLKCRFEFSSSGCQETIELFIADNTVYNPHGVEPHDLY